MSGIIGSVPDIGMARKSDRITGIPVWTVDLSIYSMSALQARQLAAELLNMADEVDTRNARLTEEQTSE